MLCKYVTAIAKRDMGRLSTSISYTSGCCANMSQRSPKETWADCQHPYHILRDAVQICHSDLQKRHGQTVNIHIIYSGMLCKYVTAIAKRDMGRLSTSISYTSGCCANMSQRSPKETWADCQHPYHILRDAVQICHSDRQQRHGQTVNIHIIYSGMLCKYVTAISKRDMGRLSTSILYTMAKLLTDFIA